MKEFRKIIAFVLALVMLSSTFVFADTAKATDAAVVVKEPTATIVSPTKNSIVNSDNFLVSVKINKIANVRISIFEQKAVNKKVVTTYVSGSAVTKEAISYSSVDVSTFEAINFTSNPALKTYVGVKLITPVSVQVKEPIEFYTARVEGLNPGLYKVLVETLETVTEKDAKTGKETKVEKVVESTSSLICVKGKKENEKDVFTTKEKTSVLTVVTNFLKSLFK